MKFTDGLNERIFDFEAEYGPLKFLGLRTTRFEADDDGLMTKGKKKVYDLLSDTKKAVVQVSLPFDTVDKKFERGTLVRLVGAVINVWANYNYSGNEVVYYISADDIVPAASAGSSKPSAAEKK